LTRLYHQILVTASAPGTPLRSTAVEIVVLPLTLV